MVKDSGIQNTIESSEMNLRARLEREPSADIMFKDLTQRNEREPQHEAAARKRADTHQPTRQQGAPNGRSKTGPGGAGKARVTPTVQEMPSKLEVVLASIPAGYEETLSSMLRREHLQAKALKGKGKGKGLPPKGSVLLFSYLH